MYIYIYIYMCVCVCVCVCVCICIYMYICMLPYKAKRCILIKSLKLSIFCFLHNLVQLFIPHPMV